jgi:hypothetical protein
MLIATDRKTLTLTIKELDDKDLSFSDARAYADGKLVEWGEELDWSYDGWMRLAYNKVEIHYVS